MLHPLDRVQHDIGAFELSSRIHKSGDWFRLFWALERVKLGGIDAVGNASKPQVARAKANNLEDILTRSE